MLQHFPLVADIAHGLSALEGPTSHEYGEACEEQTFVFVQQVIAPVKRRPGDLPFDPSGTDRRYPSIPLASLAEVVGRDYVA
jgi:hypothetical protein